MVPAFRLKAPLSMRTAPPFPEVLLFCSVVPAFIFTVPPFNRMIEPVAVKSMS